MARVFKIAIILKLFQLLRQLFEIFSLIIAIVPYYHFLNYLFNPFVSGAFKRPETYKKIR